MGNIDKNNNIASNINKLSYIYIDDLNIDMLNSNIYLVDYTKICNYKLYI